MYLTLGGTDICTICLAGEPSAATAAATLASLLAACCDSMEESETFALESCRNAITTTGMSTASPKDSVMRSSKLDWRRLPLFRAIVSLGLLPAADYSLLPLLDLLQ